MRYFENQYSSIVPWQCPSRIDSWSMSQRISKPESPYPPLHARYSKKPLTLQGEFCLGKRGAKLDNYHGVLSHRSRNPMTLAGSIKRAASDIHLVGGMGGLRSKTSWHRLSALLALLSPCWSIALHLYPGNATSCTVLKIGSLTVHVDSSRNKCLGTIPGATKRRKEKGILYAKS